ncbi:hypothetical protein Tco_0089372, partial [Tanacetum coccineum]
SCLILDSSVLSFGDPKVFSMCIDVISFQDTMAEMNVLTNTVLADQAPAITPPTRSDDDILPPSKWVPIGKSNNMLEVQKSQRNPIFSMDVALLRNTNFFRAFTASSMIPAIYIQQFWDIMRHDSSTAKDNNPFVAPPSSDTTIEYVNTLRYPNTLRNVRLLDMIDQDIRKNLSTESREKKKYLLLVIPNVRFTKLIIHHPRSKHNLHPRAGSPLYYSHDENILNALRYTGKDRRVIFGMPIPNALFTNEIRSAPYYSEYLEQVAAYQRYLAEEHKATKTAKQTKPSAPKATKPPKPAEAPKKDQGRKRKPTKETTHAPSPAKRTKAGKVANQQTLKSSLQLEDEFVDEGVPVQEPTFGEEEAIMQKVMEESLKEAYPARQGPLPPVVIREPESRKYQPLPEVPGKGKEKVDEEAAHVLLNLQTPKKKSPAEQYIFQRRTPTTTKPSGLTESSSLYVELGLTDSETYSDEEVSPKTIVEAQEEGQAGPNPDEQVKG